MRIVEDKTPIRISMHPLALCWRFAIAMSFFILFVNLAHAGPIQARTSKANETRKLQRDVPMGEGTIQISDSCLVVRAQMSAGDFFKEMQVTETPDGREYRKGPEVRTVFPEQLNVEVSLWAYKCGSDAGEDSERVKAILKGLRFIAAWKPQGGLHTDHARVSSIELARPTELDAFADPGVMPWIIKINVVADHVPLSSDLELAIVSESKKLLTRFAARL
jgi:hypothetical protein